MPRSIARVISHGMAKPIELQTFYGAQDLYDMLEIIAVDNYNANVRNAKD